MQVGRSGSRWSVGPSLVAYFAVVTLACGGATHGHTPSGSGANSGDASQGGTFSSSGGKGALGGGKFSGAGEPAVSGGTDPLGEGGALPSCERAGDEPPGEPIYDAATAGNGVCVGVTLGDIIAQVRALRPDLEDIQELYAPAPDRGGDGSFIYAFQKPDGGFAVVFRRGDGDCPAGCIINDYWYFETKDNCAPQEVGHTHRDFQTCVPPDALPRWGIPPAAPPETICEADLSPQDLSGVYRLTTCGIFQPCALPGADKGHGPLPARLVLTIAQDAGDLATGTVTLDGTGEPILDGRKLPASFTRRKLHVSVDESNLPAACIDAWQLTFDYDFEGIGQSSLQFERQSTPDCEHAPGDYCKGVVSADFGEATAK